jgi:hypothetical protein
MVQHIVIDGQKEENQGISSIETAHPSNSQESFSNRQLWLTSILMNLDECRFTIGASFVVVLKGERHL